MQGYLYNNVTSMCILIGCWSWSIKGHTQMASWLIFLFSYSQNSQINHLNFYCIKQIDYIFPCVCTVKDHKRRHSVWWTTGTPLDFVSCRTSSVIYYSTHTRKNLIYLLNSSHLVLVFINNFSQTCNFSTYYYDLDHINDKYW